MQNFSILYILHSIVYQPFWPDFKTPNATTCSHVHLTNTDLANWTLLAMKMASADRGEGNMLIQ